MVRIPRCSPYKETHHQAPRDATTHMIHFEWNYCLRQHGYIDECSHCHLHVCQLFVYVKMKLKLKVKMKRKDIQDREKDEDEDQKKEKPSCRRRMKESKKDGRWEKTCKDQHWK